MKNLIFREIILRFHKYLYIYQTMFVYIKKESKLGVHLNYFKIINFCCLILKGNDAQKNEKTEKINLI